MEVILLEDVPNLGSMGTLVRVKGGYGRNHLLPKALAMVASVKNKRRLEHEKRIVGFRRLKAQAKAKEMASRLQGLAIDIARKVGDQDKLFGSVTVLDIQQALLAHGVEVDRRKLTLAEPIRSLGEFVVPVRLDADVHAEVKVNVVREPA